MSWVHGAGRAGRSRGTRGRPRVRPVAVDADLQVGGAPRRSGCRPGPARRRRGPSGPAGCWAGSADHRAERLEPLPQPQGDVPGEAGLGIAAVGRRPGGVARLAEAAGRHRAVDPSREVVVAELVTRVDDDHPARECGSTAEAAAVQLVENRPLRSAAAAAAARPARAAASRDRETAFTRSPGSPGASRPRRARRRWRRRCPARPASRAARVRSTLA